MVVPSGNGTSVIPLPHPFLGKLADKLSENVKIKGRAAATKGSIAKHDHPVHNQLPGTIRFHKNPSKEGEITGGTGSKLKINGKEAAVVGSTVTTNIFIISFSGASCFWLFGENLYLLFICAKRFFKHGDCLYAVFSAVCFQKRWLNQSFYNFTVIFCINYDLVLIQSQENLFCFKNLGCSIKNYYIVIPC